MMRPGKTRFWSVQGLSTARHDARSTLLDLQMRRHWPVQIVCVPNPAVVLVHLIKSVKLRSHRITDVLSYHTRCFLRLWNSLNFAFPRVYDNDPMKNFIQTGVVAGSTSRHRNSARKGPRTHEIRWLDRMMGLLAACLFRPERSSSIQQTGCCQSTEFNEVVALGFLSG
jgi:hypothetical protein